MKRFTRLQLGVLIALLAFGAACSETALPLDESDVVLQEGDAAPAFTLPTSDGEELSLSDFRGKKAVLLYFSMGPG